MEFKFGNPSKIGKSKYAINATSLFNRSAFFGWLNPGKRVERHREKVVGMPDLIIGFEPASFAVNLQKGCYKVEISLGDTYSDDHLTSISCNLFKAEIPIIKSRLNEYKEISFFVEVQDQPLILNFDSPTGNWILNQINIKPVDTKTSNNAEVRTWYELFNQWPALSGAGPDTIMSELLDHKLANSAFLNTELSSRDYLQMIESIVEYFHTFQSSNGSIIDPFKREEFQYSTPAYAYCSWLLVSENNNADLVESATAALGHSIYSLVNKTVPQNHQDFFPFMIGHALRLCKKKVSQEVYQGWIDSLKTTDPFDLYSVELGGNNGPGSNWNCKALVGEFFLNEIKVRESINYSEASLSRQGRFFNNEFGMYSEGPLVYDIFPRCWLGDMVSAGYDGFAIDDLVESLRRGALTSLLLQMPDGGLPSGGRSSHHLWGDALQTMCFEIEADKYVRNNDLILAGMFKRAARRAFNSIKKYQAPGQIPSIVRNRAKPGSMHGYESYSSYSQYNLLCGLILGRAYEHAKNTENTLEVLTPTENGTFVIQLPDPFNRVIANTKGVSVSIGLSSDVGQYPAGVSGVTFKSPGFPKAIWDGIPNQAAYTTPNPKITASNGLSWLENDQWINLANWNPKKVKGHLISKITAEDTIFIDIKYADDPDSSSYVNETYRINPWSVKINYAFIQPKKVLKMQIQWLVLVSDGENTLKIENDEKSLSVKYASGKVIYSAHGCGPITLSSEIYGHRNGMVRLATAPCLVNAKKYGIEIKLQ